MFRTPLPILPGSGTSRWSRHWSQPHGADKEGQMKKLLLISAAASLLATVRDLLRPSIGAFDLI